MFYTFLVFLTMTAKLNDDCCDMDTWAYIYIYNSTHRYTAQICSKKLPMYVGPHDVYPTIDVNLSVLTRECKNKSLSTIFSLQALFCYQCVEL